MSRLHDMGLDRVLRPFFGVLIIFFFLVTPWVGFAGDLGSAKITAVRNTVEHTDGQAKKAADVGQTVTQGQSVLTKEQALAELVADDSSVIRLGANSVFSYSSKERLVKLDKGTMLMHTPPGNGGATIDSGGVVGAISGTTFMLTATPAKCSQCGQELEIRPDGKIVCRDHPDLKPSTSGFALIVLEGGSVTKVTGADGQTVEIKPGQMAVVGPKGSGAPKVYAVNVAQIARTSPLINAFPNPLPSFPKIVATAFGLQGYNPNPTGTSAVALGSGGQLLTAVSPLPNPFQISFPMAFNTPGQNNFINNSNLGNIATASGGGGSGGPVAPTGVAGGGGGPAGPTIPAIAVPPTTPGLNAIAANPNNPPTPLTVGGALVTTKIYDGTTAASIVGAFLQGAVSSGVALANETTGLFAAKDVGTGIGVTTAMTLTGANASQFTLTAQPTLAGDITPKDLRVVNAVVTIKVYDGTTDADLTGAGLDLSAPGQGTSTDGKAYTGDAVGLSSVTMGQFADKNVGIGKTVTLTTPITLTGTDAGNYTLLNQPTLIGTITAKDLSVFSAAVTTKVYDGSDSAVITGAVLVGNSTADNDGNYVGSETVTLGNNTAGTFASKNVGIGKGVTTAMTLGGADAGNYTLNTQPTLTGDITAKALTISATTPSAVVSKVYNGNRSASVTVGALDGLVVGEVLGATTAVGTFADKNIGTKNVTAVYTLVDGANPLHLASNYTLASETLTGTITAKDLSVFSAAVTTKVYDGSDAAVVTGAVLVGNSTADNDGKYIGSEVVTLSGGTTGTFVSKNVGSGKMVATTITLGGADAGNYTLNTQPTLTGTITAKALSMSGSLAATKVYDGTVTATVTVGTQTGEVAGEVLGTTTAVGTFADRNVGTGKSVTAVYTLANGANPQHLASNYSLANDTLSADITAKDLVVDVSGVTISKVYDGLFTATFTGATLSSEAVGTGTTSDGKYYTIDTVTLKDGGAGTFASQNVGAGITVTTGMSLDGLSKGNYTLSVQPTLTGTITAKALTMTGSSAGNKVYDGTANASVSIGTLSGLVVGESLGTTTVAGTFADRNVGTGKGVTAVYTLASGANAAANYSLANDTLTADITAKALTVSGGAVTTKAYDGTTVATITGAGLHSAIAAGTGSSTDGKPYSVDSVTLSGGGAGVFERNLPGTMIPVSTTMSVTGSGAGNYILTQPTTLKGEITGSANLNRDGAAISVASNLDIHIRNTTATRMQDGLTISSAIGSVLLENSSFDGWMQRSTPGTKVDDGGAVTFQFTEGAALAVVSPVLRLKMEANNPAAAPSAGGANLDYMLLGDYQLHLRHDPDGIANNGDEAATTVFSFPGKDTDPNRIGSLAPSADLVIRDSALTQMKDLPWDTQSFSSLDVNGEAVASGSYATAAGEYKPDGPAAMSDLNTTTSAGKWDLTVSDPVLGGEGKVTDLRLKYNNNTKALIEGPDGVRLVNVKFEGMDEVEVKADLNNRILMSGTLVSDPNISKMVVKAGQTMEAQLASDATIKEINTSAGNAEILAGVKPDPANPGKYLDIVGGTERILEMQTANIAGQLTLTAHTMVFNNANITSAGVIEARTRDGMVNRTYGNVVPGTVSFIGANGNHFVNTANSSSMTIANSANIVSAINGGKMSENGAGGATVMNVGRLR